MSTEKYNKISVRYKDNFKESIWCSITAQKKISIQQTQHGARSKIQNLKLQILPQKKTTEKIQT